MQALKDSSSSPPTSCSKRNKRAFLTALTLTPLLLVPAQSGVGLAGEIQETLIKQRLERAANASLAQLARSPDPSKPDVHADAAARLRLEQMVNQASSQLAATNAGEAEIRLAEDNLRKLVGVAAQLATPEPLGGGGSGAIRGPSNAAILQVRNLREAMGQLCPVFPFC